MNEQIKDGGSVARIMDLVFEAISSATMIGYATSSNERKSHGDQVRKISQEIRADIEAMLADREAKS